MKYYLCIFVLLISSNSFSCSCTPRIIEEDIKDADYIYIGLVINSQLQKNGEVNSTMKIEEVLKGKPDKNTAQGTSGKFGMCGREIIVGKKYIIYGHVGSIPEVSACSKSHYLPYYNGNTEEIETIRSLVNKALQQAPSALDSL